MLYYIWVIIFQDLPNNECRLPLTLTQPNQKWIYIKRHVIYFDYLIQFFDIRITYGIDSVWVSASDSLYPSFVALSFYDGCGKSLGLFVTELSVGDDDTDNEW